MLGIAPLSALAAVGLTDLKTKFYVRRTIQIAHFAGDRIRVASYLSRAHR
jgi:hypothetical protein